jgi:hypothetical protein
VSALARVLINVANVRSFRGSMIATACGLEFNEVETGNGLLNEDRNLLLNEAISAGKRAYSRALLVYSDAVALLPSSTADSGETTRIASAAQRISKIKSPRGNSPRTHPHRSSGSVARGSAARGQRQRTSGVLCKYPTRRHCLSGGKANTCAWVRGCAGT